VAPCTIRKKISIPRLAAIPQSTDAIEKPMTAASSSRFLPIRRESQPVSGRMMAFATRYDVSVQVASSMLADRLPAMCGRETFTTVVSSTSMKVASITETATIQGFTAGFISEHHFSGACGRLVLWPRGGPPP
jgi:hypothetical protein